MKYIKDCSHLRPSLTKIGKDTDQVCFGFMAKVVCLIHLPKDKVIESRKRRLICVISFSFKTIPWMNTITKVLISCNSKANLIMSFPLPHYRYRHRYDETS